MVRRLMPNASEQELREAQENLRQYLDVVFQIYGRLEREKKQRLGESATGEL